MLRSGWSGSARVTCIGSVVEKSEECHDHRCGSGARRPHSPEASRTPKTGAGTRSGIDTGFTASLSLPPSLVASLGLPWKSFGRGILADGSACLFDVYVAKVLWDGKKRRVLVDEADTDPLVGMALLSGYESTM